MSSITDLTAQHALYQVPDAVWIGVEHALSGIDIKVFRTADGAATWASILSKFASQNGRRQPVVIGPITLSDHVLLAGVVVPRTHHLIPVT